MSNSDEVYKPSNDLGGLIGLPARMKAEERSAYSRLYAEVRKVVQPTNVFDQMLVSDITYHFWEQQRLRACSDAVVEAARRDALWRLIMPMLNHCEPLVEAYADAYFGTADKEREPAYDKQDVIALLQKHGLDESAIDPAAIEVSLDTLMRLEALSSKHEIRREEIVLEVERRKAMRGASHRRIAQPRGKSPPRKRHPGGR